MSCMILIPLISFGSNINIDSILEEYTRPVFEQQNDSVLVLGEIKLKWRGDDGRYYSADSGVKVSCLVGGEYVEFTAEKDGLCHSVISADIFSIKCHEVAYGSLVISIDQGEISLASGKILGVDFLTGKFGKLRPGFDHSAEAESDTIYDWVVVWSQDSIKILEDFLRSHPGHRFASTAQAYCNDLKLYHKIMDLLNDGLYSKARTLCLNARRERPNSVFLGYTLGLVATMHGDYYIKKGDTTKAVAVLKSYLTPGRNPDIVGRVANLVLIEGVKGSKIACDVMAEFLTNFTDERGVYLFKYKFYMDRGSYRKAEMLCKERLKKYPDDSLAYGYLIDLYCCIDSMDRAIRSAKEALKKKVKIEGKSFL